MAKVTQYRMSLSMISVEDVFRKVSQPTTDFDDVFRNISNNDHKGIHVLIMGLSLTNKINILIGTSCLHKDGDQR